jgi:predicted  nucleic acid-binding Zn-ribbon protein
VSESPLDAILRLGELDRTLFGVRRRRVQALAISAPQENRHAEAKRALEKLKDGAKEHTRAMTRLDGDMKAKQAEIDKTQVQLNQTKNNDDYQALLRAIQNKKNELGDIETKILEGYEAAEARVKEQKELEAKLKVLDGELAEAKKRAQAELSVVDADVKKLEEQRKAAAALVSAEHLAIYQRVLETNKDAATAAVLKDICQGCFMKVRPEQVSQIRGKGIATCFTCSRILYLPG